MKRQVPALIVVAALGTAWGAAQAATPEELSTKAGCVACHMPAKKLVGPSWKDVAAKYKADAKAPALLAERVRKGSKGVWGPVAMMPTGPDKLGDADLKAVIAWILKTP